MSSTVYCFSLPPVKAEKVFIDGHLSFDATKKNGFIRTDFDLGIINPEGDRL